MRPHWDDIWLEVAGVLATRSLCSRAQVGAVIVGSDNRIVSTGYNNPARGFDHRGETCEVWCLRGQGDVIEQSYANCPSLHAEANALMAGNRLLWQGGTLYITGHVCADCAKLIGNSGLARIVIQDDGVDREYRNYDETYRGLRSLGIGVEIFAAPTPPDDRSIYRIAWRLLNDEFMPNGDDYKGVSKDIHNTALQMGWHLTNEPG